MLVDIFQILILLAFIGAAVLLIVAQEREDKQELFRRIAAITGIVLGVITLSSNLLVLAGPELVVVNGRFALLLFLAAIVPVVTIVGAILALLRKRGGLRLLAIGLWLWIAYSGLGFLGAAAGWLG